MYNNPYLQALNNTNPNTNPLNNQQGINPPVQTMPSLDQYEAERARRFQIFSQSQEGLDLQAHQRKVYDEWEAKTFQQAPQTDNTKEFTGAITELKGVIESLKADINTLKNKDNVGEEEI